MAKKNWKNFFKRKLRQHKKDFNFNLKKIDDVIDFGEKAYKFDGKRWVASKEEDEQELEISDSYNVDDPDSFASSKALRDLSINVDTRIANLVDSAPTTLNTLNELAAAIGDDKNHVTTMINLVATKADATLGNVGTLPSSVKSQLKGDTGPKGATGAKGITGAKGDKGLSGTAGSKGDKGNTGSRGSNGSNGATGATGPKGNTGSTGSKGSNGSNGSTGAKGNNGATGARGAAGSNGSTGSRGSTGARGSAGARGSTGAKGSTGSTGAKGSVGASFSVSGSTLYITT